VPDTRARARERAAHEIFDEVKEICGFSDQYARARGEQAERWAEGSQARAKAWITSGGLLLGAPPHVLGYYGVIGHPKVVIVHCPQIADRLLLRRNRAMRLR
jgi:hypothetical protein